MQHRPPARVWLITGASRGFGRLFTQAAADRATASSPPPGARPTSPNWLVGTPSGSVALPLDVADRGAVLGLGVERAGRRSAAWTSWSTTPATACPAPSRRSPRRKPGR